MTKLTRLHLSIAGDKNNRPSTIPAATTAQRWANLEMPAFERHRFDAEGVRRQLASYQKYNNIIIIGDGGSRTSALMYYQALAHQRNDKRIEFLCTMEPDVISALQERYSSQDTLVMPISKSGENVDALEPLLQFLNYPVLAVTSAEGGVLQALAAQQGWGVVNHPNIGGRYAGRSECAYAPALLMGLDVQKIDAAAVAAYGSLNWQAPPEGNIALQAAQFCFDREQQGYTEIFMPVYSQELAGFLPLVVQLVHESTGKDGQGQTIFGDQAPESQHHTNQRFFGGRRNVLGFFITVGTQRHNLTTHVPKALRDLPLRDGTLGDLDGVALAEGLRFDYEGVAETAAKLQIPYLTLEVDAVSEASVGELLSFFHFYTVYSALLRGQDPFDQPAVEAAKAVSFEKRKRAA